MCQGHPEPCTGTGTIPVTIYICLCGPVQEQAALVAAGDEELVEGAHQASLINVRGTLARLPPMDWVDGQVRGVAHGCNWLAPEEVPVGES